MDRDPVEAGFRARVYAVVCAVPAGRVTTYGDVAAAVGSPRAARQVGWALAALSDAQALEVPWQRVINAAGRISHRGDTGRAELQRALLEAEGLVFRADRVDLPRVRWQHLPPELDPPG